MYTLWELCFSLITPLFLVEASYCVRVVINPIVSYRKYVGQELHVRTVVGYSTSLTLVHNIFPRDVMWPKVLIKWFGHALNTLHRRNRTFFYFCIAVCIYMHFWSHCVAKQKYCEPDFSLCIWNVAHLLLSLMHTQLTAHVLVDKMQ